MRDLNSIRRHARAIVAKAAGPLGPRPTQRFVRDNLDFFSDLRDAGGSWDQIARLLRDEGLVSRAGGNVEAGVLRMLYSRAMKERAPVPAPGPGPAGKQPANTARGKNATIPPKKAGLPSKRTSPEPGSLAERLERVTRLRGPMQTEE